jgi:hypothetical protein
MKDTLRFLLHLVRSPLQRVERFSAATLVIEAAIDVSFECQMVVREKNELRIVDALLVTKIDEEPPLIWDS